MRLKVRLKERFGHNNESLPITAVWFGFK